MSELIGLSDDLRRLLDSPNYAHLSTLRADGTPRNSVVWVGREGDNVLVCTSTNSHKARDMTHNAAVAISITAHDDPYQMASMQGRVIEVRDDSDGAYKDALSYKYTGQPYPTRSGDRVCFVIGIIIATGRTIPFRHKPSATTPPALRLAAPSDTTSA
jgi:PPOX class probable F420-dependent enzyme